MKVLLSKMPAMDGGARRYIDPASVRRAVLLAGAVRPDGHDRDPITMNCQICARAEPGK